MVVSDTGTVKGTEERKSGRREVPLILVDEGLCKRCGICIAFCPTKVFDVREDGLPIVARREDCIWCGLCEVRCPDFAILLKGESQDHGAKGGKLGGEAVSAGTETRQGTQDLARRSRTAGGEGKR